jgi:hypothetical protein
MKKGIALVLSLSVLSACSTVPLDPSKPVSYGFGFFQQGFTQGSSFVNEDEAEKAVEAVPAANEKLKSARAHQWTAIGMIIGGAVVSQVTIANSDNPTSAPGYWIGLGAILGSLPFSLTAQSHYRQAAEEYNQAKFTIQPKTSLYLSPLKDGGIAGLQLQF